MPAWKSQTYSLLQHDPQNASTEDLNEQQYAADKETDYTSNRCQSSISRQNGCLIVLLLISVATNVLLAIGLSAVLLKPKNQMQEAMPLMSKPSSRYAGITEDVAAPYPWSIGYGPEITNHSLADERWEDIDIDDGIILLDDDYVKEHNLSPSQRFPWDPSKGVYLLNSFHTLHCLKNIHRLLYDAHHGRPLSRDITHAMHCVDHIRKDTMCEADDFPLPSPPSRHELPGPNGQTKVCKNWDALVSWAKERNACFKQLTDDEAGYAKDHHQVERFRYCPPDSPYYETMSRYFETHDL